MTNFNEDEMALINDPLFSKKVVGQYEQKPLKQKSRSRKHKFLTHAIKDTGDSENRNTAKCPVCDDHHNIDKYQVFLSETIKDSSNTLYKKKLYYGFQGNISKEHNEKSCDNKRMCKVFSVNFLKVLHSLKIQKYKKKGNNEDTDINERKEEKVKYALTNTRSDVVRMCIVSVQLRSKDTGKTAHFYALLDSCSQGTFILNQLTNDLGISGRKTSLTMKTLNRGFSSNSRALAGFKVTSISEANNEWLLFPRTFSRPYLAVDNDDITKSSQCRK